MGVLSCMRPEIAPLPPAAPCKKGTKRYSGAAGADLSQALIAAC